MSALWELLRARVAEPLLLTSAEHAARRYAPAQAERVRQLARAVAARRSAAAELREAQRVPAALVLYREAIVLAVTARLAARGDHERSVLTPTEAWAELQPLAASARLGQSERLLEALGPLLAGDDALAPDALSQAAREEARAACEDVLDQLETSYEGRTPRQLRTARIVRLAIAALGLALLLAASMAYARTDSAASGSEVFDERP